MLFSSLIATIIANLKSGDVVILTNHTKVHRNNPSLIFVNSDRNHKRFAQYINNMELKLGDGLWQDIRKSGGVVNHSTTLPFLVTLDTITMTVIHRLIIIVATNTVIPKVVDVVILLNHMKVFLHKSSLISINSM